MRHTQESFPIARLSFENREEQGHRPKLYDMCALVPTQLRELEVGGGLSIQSYVPTRLLLPTFGFLIITAALTSFLLLAVTGAWSWTRIFASFGLFTSLSLSSIMWAYVYLKQQAPGCKTDHRRTNSTPMSKFAVMHTVVGHKLPAILCDLQGISTIQEWGCRLCSLIAGGLVAVG